MKIRTSQKYQILVERKSGRTGLWRENTMLMEKYPILSYANNKQVRRLVQFWQNFQTSLVLLIPNCTRHRMITYTNILRGRLCKSGPLDICSENI